MAPTHFSTLIRSSHLPRLALIAAVTLCATRAWATDYYVATDGSDANPGTIAAPFATMQKGADTAAAGDSVYIRGGTYSITTPKTSGAGVTFTKSGADDTTRINYFAYAGEKPVFDFANLVISTTGYTHGFVVTGSYLHFRGLELKNVPENTRSNNAIAVNGGGHDIFELLDLHHNSGNGIFIGDGKGGHLVLNSDAHDNYDATSAQGDGQNADGFGVHYQTSGDVTTLRGCRAWWNSDDGYDLINQEVPVTIENSWAMGNGYINSGTARPAQGNGNGFKAGSSKTGVRHVIRQNLAWKNAASGFYANHSSGGNDWLNNTSYGNGTQYNMLASDPNDSSVTIVLMGALAHHMRNNIGFPNKNTNMDGVDSAFDTWDLGITPANADFASVDDTGFMGPRAADGSLPNIDFMKLPMGSPLIDKGTDVGLAYAGGAPDLGAFESGVVSSGGTGAGGPSTGSAGSDANGGASGSGAPGAGGAVNRPGGSGGAAGSALGGGISNGGSGVAGSAVESPSRTSANDSAGCSCRAARSRSGRAGLPALLGLALLGARRHRPRVSRKRTS